LRAPPGKVYTPPAMAPPRPARRFSWFSFLVYLVSLLLVGSFVLFEVLDIDGSDFPISPDAVGHWIRLSEAEAVHDLRRFLPERALLVVLAAAPVLRPPAGETLEQPAHRSGIQVPMSFIAHRFRPLLPRASLGDASAC
jgi:hypothetical protein